MQHYATVSLQSTSAASGAATLTATITTAAGTAHGPIELSPTCHRITTEEKAQRIAEGHCYCCGGLRNIVRDCLLRIQDSAILSTSIVNIVVNMRPPITTTSLVTIHTTTIEELEN